MNKKIKLQSGYLMIEVLISIVIFTMIALTIFSTISSVVLRTEKSRYSQTATLLAQEAIEGSYNIMAGSWNGPDGTYRLVPVFVLVNNTPQRIWSLVPGTEEDIQTRFSREIQIRTLCRNSQTGDEIPCTPASQRDNLTKVITTTVRWQETGREPEPIVASLTVFRPHTI